MFEPNAPICAITWRLLPSPTASMTTTEATPMMIPSRVSAVRNRLIHITRQAARAPPPAVRRARPRGFAAALGEALAEIVGLQVALDAGARLRRALVVGAVADDLAVAHLDDALGAGGDVAVVGDQDHHVALAGLVEQRHDFRAAVAVEGAGGFVGEDDMAAVHQRTGDRHPLLLAAGQLVRTVGGALGQAQAFEQGPRAVCRSLAGVPA